MSLTSRIHALLHMYVTLLCKISCNRELITGLGCRSVRDLKGMALLTMPGSDSMLPFSSAALCENARPHGAVARAHRLGQLPHHNN